MMPSCMFQSKTMSVFVFCICTLMLGFGLWVGWLGQRRRPEALKKSRKNWSSALLCSFAASLAHPRHTCVHMPVFMRATVKLYVVHKTRVLELSAHFLFIYFWQIWPSIQLNWCTVCDGTGLKKSIKGKFCIFHNVTVLIFSQSMCTILFGELLCCILHCWFCIVWGY